MRMDKKLVGGLEKRRNDINVSPSNINMHGRATRQLQRLNKLLHMRRGSREVVVPQLSRNRADCYLKTLYSSFTCTNYSRYRPIKYLNGHRSKNWNATLPMVYSRCNPSLVVSLDTAYRLRVNSGTAQYRGALPTARTVPTLHREDSVLATFREKSSYVKTS